MLRATGVETYGEGHWAEILASGRFLSHRTAVHLKVTSCACLRVMAGQVAQPEAENELSASTSLFQVGHMIAYSFSFSFSH